jgi:hypothetical protein
MENEKWAEIPGAGGNYYASSLGRIGSVPRAKTKGGVLKPTVSPQGYHRVMLYVNGKRVRAFVHRLVLSAFIAECPEGKEAAHLDGTRDNNRLENLAWVSRSENHSHKIQHGTWQGGENNPYAKLTQKAVMNIRKELRNGTKQRDIAEIHRVSEQAISDIKHGKRWSPPKWSPPSDCAGHSAEAFNPCVSAARAAREGE